MNQRNISDAFDNLLKEAEHIGKKDEFMTYVRERSTPFVYEPVWDAGHDCDLKCPECFDRETDPCDICKKHEASGHGRPMENKDKIGVTVFGTEQEAIDFLLHKRMKL